MLAVSLPLLLSGCQSAHEYVVENERGFLVDLVAWIFDIMLDYILFTPVGMFKSATAISLVIKFGVISGSLVTILSLFEGIKRMMNMQYTPVGQILRRYPIALAVSGFAPLLFYWMGIGANEIVNLIGLITGATLKQPGMFVNKWHQLGDSIYMSFLTFLFLIAMLWYLMKALMTHATRWFGLLFNCITTPLVMLSYIFKSYEHVAKSWFTDTLAKYAVQIYHSFFLSMIAVIMYAPNVVPFADNIDGSNSMLLRLMLSIGGLHLMDKPPAWVRNATAGDNSKDYLASVGKIVKLVISKKTGGIIK